MMKRFLQLFAILSIGLLASCSSSSKVDAAVKAANTQCPMDLAGEATITQIVTEGNNIVFYCEWDESALGGKITELMEGPQKAIIKDAMIHELRAADQETQKIIDLCKEAKYNIKYKMKGSPSGETVEIIILHEEL